MVDLDVLRRTVSARHVNLLACAVVELNKRAVYLLVAYDYRDSVILPLSRLRVLGISVNV
jgi:hypothetical protein